MSSPEPSPADEFLAVLPDLGDPVLVDPAHDGRLRHHGFTTLDDGPLIAPHEAASLRDAFGAVHGWDGGGWHNSFNVFDTDYRRTAGRDLGAVLDEPVRRRFRHHEPFLFTYLCKWPGDDSYLGLHRDWMYVDERLGHRTFVVFVALEDIGADNGMVQVLPRSHEFDPMLRGTNMHASWLEHRDEIVPRMATLPLGVGEAAVWNTAVTHASGANRSSTPRLAAGVWLRPRGVPLVHFRRRDDEVATMHPVADDDFYEATPYQWVEGMRSEAIDVVPVRGRTHTQAELADALDRLNP